MLLNNKKMITIEKIKRIFDNFLETRVYNYHKAKKKSKAIASDAVTAAPVSIIA